MPSRVRYLYGIKKNSKLTHLPILPRCHFMRVGARPLRAKSYENIGKNSSKNALLKHKNFNNFLNFGLFYLFFGQVLVKTNTKICRKQIFEIFIFFGFFGWIVCKNWKNCENQPQIVQKIRKKRISKICFLQIFCIGFD